MTIETPMDAAHIAALEKCKEHGHSFGEWEPVKFIQGEERRCSCCMLHESIIRGNHSRSFAIGSIWKGTDEVTNVSGFERLLDW